VKLFWANADCGHRNPEQLSRFKPGEIIQLKHSVKGTRMLHHDILSFSYPHGLYAAAKRKPGPGRSSVGFVLGTRVFALWREDQHYYSAIVQKRLGKDTYLVQFDDDESEVKVSLSQMRLCEKLQPRDSVILKTDSVLVSDFRKDGSFTVKKLVDFSAVKISAYDIHEEWGDRKLLDSEIVCALN
jgi:hypothetical protein